MLEVAQGGVAPKKQQQQGEGAHRWGYPPIRKGMYRYGFPGRSVSVAPDCYTGFWGRVFALVFLVLACGPSRLFSSTSLWRWRETFDAVLASPLWFSPYSLFRPTGFNCFVLYCNMIVTLGVVCYRIVGIGVGLGQGGLLYRTNVRVSVCLRMVAVKVGRGMRTLGLRLCPTLG